MTSNDVTGAQLAGTWVWLFPISQALHAIEEYVQGYAFHRWLRGASESEFSHYQTKLMHFTFVIAVAAAAWLSIRSERARWMVIALGVLVLLNSVSHLVGAVVAPWATSGLMTSVGVWLPLAGVALVKGWRYLPRRRYILGIAVGVAVQVPISWLAAVAG